MTRVNIHEAKTHLSRYLERVEAGETVVICRRNTPVAEIRGIVERNTKPRTIGREKARFVVPASFFEPLPDDVLDAFEQG